MPEIMSEVQVDRTDVPTTSEDGQLVVDRPQLELVTGRLAQLNVRPTQPPEVDEALGLALLRLPPGTDVHELALQLRSADFAATPVLGTNPHLAAAPATMHPYPETKPHPYVLAPGVLPTPGPEVDPASGVHVGVLDVDDSVVGAQAPSLLAGHGAFVHSLVLDQAPDATVTVRRVPADRGRATAWDVAKAMMALADAGAQVIHLSLGCHTPDGEPPLVLRRAVELLGPRVLVVAAAGSRGPTSSGARPTWPAAVPGVVAVGARNADDSLADFSPRQPWVTCTAPGSLVIDLTATVPLLDGTSLDFTGYAIWSDTAFAAATVSGAIAAKAVPGQVTAPDALAGLLAGDGGVARKYVSGNDGQRA